MNLCCECKNQTDYPVYCIKEVKEPWANKPYCYMMCQIKNKDGNCQDFEIKPIKKETWIDRINKWHW